MDTDPSDCMAVWLFHAHIPVLTKADTPYILRGIYSGRGRQMEAVHQHNPAAADTHHIFQPGHADDKRTAGIHSMLYHHPGPALKLNVILYGPYV